jgi:hypothetical protein
LSGGAAGVKDRTSVGIMNAAERNAHDAGSRANLADRIATVEDSYGPSEV